MNRLNIVIICLTDDQLEVAVKYTDREAGRSASHPTAQRDRQQTDGRTRAAAAGTVRQILGKLLSHSHTHTRNLNFRIDSAQLGRKTIAANSPVRRGRFRHYFTSTERLTTLLAAMNPDWLGLFQMILTFRLFC